MKSSDERTLVRFYLPRRYYQEYPSSSGMQFDDCMTVLVRAFCPSAIQFSTFKHKVQQVIDSARRNDYDGFYVICTQAAFGRFIIYRNELGRCINGIKDLAPEFGQHFFSRQFVETCESIGVEPHVAHTVLQTFDKSCIGLDDTNTLNLSGEHYDF